MARGAIYDFNHVSLIWLHSWAIWMRPNRWNEWEVVESNRKNWKIFDSYRNRWESRISENSEIRNNFKFAPLTYKELNPVIFIRFSIYFEIHWVFQHILISIKLRFNKTKLKHRSNKNYETRREKKHILTNH